MRPQELNRRSVARTMFRSPHLSAFLPWRGPGCRLASSWRCGAHWPRRGRTSLRKTKRTRGQKRGGGAAVKCTLSLRVPTILHARVAILKFCFDTYFQSRRPHQHDKRHKCPHVEASDNTYDCATLPARGSDVHSGAPQAVSGCPNASLLVQPSDN